MGYNGIRTLIIIWVERTYHWATTSSRSLFNLKQCLWTNL